VRGDPRFETTMSQPPPTTERPDQWEPATQLIRGGLSRSPFGETSEAMFLTQSFVYGSAEEADARFAGTSNGPQFVYSRYSNPTTQMFEDKLALLEGAELCRSTASGMAAIATALTGLVKAGDHVLSGRALFGSCRWILDKHLPRFGVETTSVAGPDLDAWKAAIRPNTKVVLIETPANPLLEITDIEEVVYSATKHIDGGGRVLGGAILGKQALLEEAYKDFLRHTGPALSPFNAWVLLKGLETLELRVDRQTKSAAALADLVADHPAAKRVFYPHRKDHPQYAVAKKQMSAGSTLLAFDLGSQQAAFNFLNALQIVDISNNLGDSKSLATHPTTTTHRSMSEEDRLAVGVTPGCVRLSVGLEGLGDLSRDIGRALDAA
jgi:O-succinylhomoserine sulfhydrylase